VIPAFSNAIRGFILTRNAAVLSFFVAAERWIVVVFLHICSVAAVIAQVRYSVL
jgi:hypothetical protein